MLQPIIDVLDSSSLRAGAYFVAAAQALWWGFRERHWIVGRDLDWWPTYWFLSAATLITLGLARAGGFGDLVSEIGRDQARSSGWYESRRAFQALAVIIVAAGWATGVVVAIWRVPPRRRRYLPHVLAISTVIAFAAVRMVSLHHIDAVLYRRDIAGVRIVVFAELSLLIATLWIAVEAGRVFFRREPARL